MVINNSDAANNHSNYDGNSGGIFQEEFLTVLPLKVKI